jgi:hypothetical protein
MGGSDGDVAHNHRFGSSSSYSCHVCLRRMILKANSLASAVHVMRDTFPPSLFRSSDA